MGAWAETNHWQDDRRPDNEAARDCRRRGNRLTSQSQRAMSTNSKDPLSLIQILEAKYLSKAGKQDIEE